MQFKVRHPHYEFLRKKWLSKHRDISQSFFDRHGRSLRHLALGGLGGLVVLTTPGMALVADNADFKKITPESHQLIIEEDKNATMAEVLRELLPKEMRKLTVEEEDKIGEMLSKNFHLKATAHLDGIRLNRSFGLIGGEQHLYRYPGDNLYKHSESTTDWAMYGAAGIAPGLGAWGYFTSSEKEFTIQDKERERYYIAVQTFLAPGFAENVAEYRDFFRFRKMLVVNPQTGQSVVTVVGDSGPADWTGKHLGGSPEVMHHLGLAMGDRKGAVLYFFIDDPNDKISLGPIAIKLKIKN